MPKIYQKICKPTNTVVDKKVKFFLFIFNESFIFINTFECFRNLNKFLAITLLKKIQRFWDLIWWRGLNKRHRVANTDVTGFSA